MRSPLPILSLLYASGVLLGYYWQPPGTILWTLALGALQFQG